METRVLVVALISILNFAVETLEKLVSEDGGDAEKEKGARPSRAKKAAKPAKDEDEDDDEVPTEDDVIDAVRAAQKVLEKDDISKILMKYAKAKRASEVEEGYRKRVIDALAKAVEDAE